MSSGTDPSGAIHAAEIAIGEDEPEVALRALVEAAKESCDDPEDLIDAGHELKSHGMQIRDGGSDD